MYSLLKKKIISNSLTFFLFLFFNFWLQDPDLHIEDADPDPQLWF